MPLNAVAASKYNHYTAPNFDIEESDMIFNRKTSVPVLGALVPALALGILGCDEEKKRAGIRASVLRRAPRLRYLRTTTRAERMCSRFGRRVRWLYVSSRS